MTIINFQKKYIFINNPQTGSEFMCNLLLAHHPESHLIKKYKQTNFSQDDNFMSLKKYLDSLNIDIKDFYIFGFVRNPVTRIQSCYLAEHHYQFSNVRNLKLNSQDFNYYIKFDLNLSFHGMDTVFLDQRYQIPSNVYIFKIEQLSKYWELITSKVDLPPLPIPTIKEKRSGIDFFLRPQEAILLRRLYPIDWYYYFHLKK